MAVGLTTDPGQADEMIREEMADIAPLVRKILRDGHTQSSHSPQCEGQISGPTALRS